MITKEKLALTVKLPWSYTDIIKTIQRRASSDNNFKIHGDSSGIRITATVQKFLDLGLAKSSNKPSLHLVSRLREANLKVTGSRTVHFPGRVSAVEIKLNESPVIASRVAQILIQKGPPDSITVYDREGTGHSRVLGSQVGGTFDLVDPCRVSKRQGGRARRLVVAEVSDYTDLIKAIQDIWEKSAEDLTQLVDWDESDYEAYTVQELISGCMDQFLTEDQLQRWESLEPEVQTAILDRAFPEDKIQDSANRLDRHHDSQTRGASILEQVRGQESSLESRVDPLDLGVGQRVRLAKLYSGNTIHNLFS